MSSRSLSRVLVTGGAGFIGSNVIHFLLSQPNFKGEIINLDALTYAGHLENLKGIESRYHFVHGDIRDRALLNRIFEEYEIDTVIHLAAESHVDRSISGPAEFVTANVVGTFELLDTARHHWKDRDDVLFHHVSTDEVFGSLGATGSFHEETRYDPRSPYSASKAASDHFVRAYGHTYGLPYTISNCSNNYGPYQFPEKLIPVMIMNLIHERPLPVYGDGLNVRDWLYVEDHASAIWAIMQRSPNGETWNIGGDNEWANIKLVESLCTIVAERLGRDVEKAKSLIQFVKDRPGHDRRYAIDTTKARTKLGWTAAHAFDDGLRRTVDWYLDNEAWLKSVQS